MPITNYNVRAASAVVKREADARGSRDEGTVLAAVGPLEVGTIMVRDNAGALTALFAIRDVGIAARTGV